MRVTVRGCIRRSNSTRVRMRNSRNSTGTLKPQACAGCGLTLTFSRIQALPHSMLCCATLSLLIYMDTVGYFEKSSSETGKGTCLTQKATSYRQTTLTNSTRRFISTTFIWRKACIVLTVTSDRTHTAMVFCTTNRELRLKSIVKIVMAQFSNVRRCLLPVSLRPRLAARQLNDASL